ncbi:hypothetical protein QEN19_000422 [Hanseniaspora menglaensis]
MSTKHKKNISRSSHSDVKKNKIINGVNLSNLLVGPLKLLCEVVEEHREVIISLRNNHKMYANVKAFDKHCNILIYNIKEVWSEKNWETKTHVSKERYISQAFLRGDNIIMIVKCPAKKRKLVVTEKIEQENIKTNETTKEDTIKAGETGNEGIMEHGDAEKKDFIEHEESESTSVHVTS